MMTSSPRTTAPMDAPSGNGISATILPTTRELRSSPCTIASNASAAPRLRECTRTTSPRRTYASSEPMVTVCGEMAMSMLLLSTSSVYEGLLMSAIALCAPRRLASIAVQHDGVVQEFRDAACLARIALDDLHLVVRLERLGEAEADVAAAGDDDAPRRVVGVAQFAHDATYVVARRQEEYLVALLHDGVTLGGNAAAVTVDGDHAHLHLGQMPLQLAQALTDQEAVAPRPHPHQAHLAVGEIQHLQRAGMIDETLDVIGHQLLG